jgi:hypothetical protein
MYSINRKVALILTFLLGTLSSELVFAQSCESLNNQPPEPSWLDSNGLLPAKHNPASVLPKNNPRTTNEKELVPSVPMTSEMCTAIRLFDASVESERHYDLVNCLDGLTFGFGNWPQGELGEFFQKLSQDTNAEKALVARFVEVFKANPTAWSAFRRDAGLADTVDAATVRTGIKNLLASARIENAHGLKNRSSDGTCKVQPEKGKSFYFDHAKWLVPTLEYAFRDPAIVAFQVSFWDEDVLSKAKSYSDAFGLPKEGMFLMAFCESNLGAIPKTLKEAISKKKPPETLKAGGRNWKWDGTDRPSALGGVSLNKWHTLLFWQAMCPDSSGSIRIRNRNLKFFSEYLAEDFKLPTETQTGRPSSGDPKNCNPALVKLRH